MKILVLLLHNLVHLDFILTVKEIASQMWVYNNSQTTNAQKVLLQTIKAVVSAELILKFTQNLVQQDNTWTQMEFVNKMQQSLYFMILLPAKMDWFLILMAIVLIHQLFLLLAQKDSIQMDLEIVSEIMSLFL